MTTVIYTRALDCAGCGHPDVSHVLSDRAPRRRTWCSVWIGKVKCECTAYSPKESE